MAPDRWSEVEKLYHAALEREPAERIAFLNRTCTDEQLRREVESLIEHEEEGDQLLENLPWQLRPALSIGMRLGPYEIVSAIEAGGMGEVYQALDTRLDRKVAIKVSAKQFSERFEREARAIAALNHPHVCTLHDVGPNYLVMELVEGETLATRLNKGPLPSEKVVRYGVQIADALAEAHAHGIIHRDLKPGNIMLTKTGVKVLDFGLAKFARPDGSAKNSQKLTGEQAIMGTLAYMPPEQLAGRECDARTDIYSFGLVLYEMLTGKQASDQERAGGFEQGAGSSQAVAPLDRIIRKCLAKDPEERWQSARDLKTNLEWAGSWPVVQQQTKIRPRTLVLGVAAAALAIAAIIGWFTWPRSDMLQAHFVLSPPEGTRIALRLPNKPLVTVAPDGRKLLLVAVDDAGLRSLWVRPLNSTAYQRIDGTEGASLAFWSPDSRFIAFFADGKLKKIPASGGPPQTICEAGVGDGEGGTWSQDGVILFPAPRKTAAALPTGALSRVPSAGGTVEPATALDKDHGEVSHSWPQFLPDGRHFLYLARNENPEKTRIYVQELGSPERRTLLNSKTLAVYAKGPSGRPYLLFPRDRALLAQPFNLSRFELYDEPVAVAAEVSYNTMYGTSAFSVSDNGVLAYRSGTFGGSNTALRQLAWYSRQGQRLAGVGEAGVYGSIALSPDERRVAVQRKVKLDDLKDWDIWILEFASGIFSRLTPGPSFLSPVWSPDSRKIAAVSEVGNRQDLVEITMASGATTVLFSDQEPKALETWTPDGRYLLFTAGPAPAAFQLPLSGERKPQSILNSDFYNGRFKVSPDRRWIAYQSTESGKHEVYVRSFPGLDQKRQISSGGGSQPLWSKDGKELFYLTLNAKLMVVDVKSGASLETSNPRLLFQSPVDGNPVLGQYAVTGDGQRFLMIETARVGRESGIEQFQVELNWFAELRTKDTGTK